MNTNKFLKCLLALGLTASLMTGCSSTKEDEESEVETTVEIEPNKATGKVLTKDETVYVLCDGGGSVNQIIVSDWIKNGTEQETIEDESTLNDIEVSKGTSTYTMDKDAMIWDADSGDVYYQGESSDYGSLPVGMNVTYTLNGKDIALEDLEDQSGHLKITIDYQNYLKDEVEINGQKETIYVPFIMLSGMLLDDTYSDVKVSNGKIIELENQTALMGFALPGLQEDLGMLEDEIDIPSTVTIEADIEHATAPTIMTIATNSLLEELDFDSIDDVDGLKESMSELQDGFDQLIDGSSTLYDGMSTLLTSANTLVDAISTIANGTEQLKQGADQLYDGSISLRDNLAKVNEGTATLTSGIQTLNDGLTTLSNNSEALRTGAKQVYTSLIANVQDSLNENADQLTQLGISVPTLTTDNFETEIDKIISALDQSNLVKVVENQVMSQVVAAVDSDENKALIEQGVSEAVKEQVTIQVTQAVKEQIRDAVLTSVNYTLDAYNSNDTIKSLVDAQVEALLPQYQSVIDAQVEAQMQSETVQALIQSNIEAQRQSLISSNYETALNDYMNSEAGQATLATANATAVKLSTTKASIVSYRDQFYQGLLQYTYGVDQAADGAASLLEGSQTLSNGISQLYDGSVTLTDGILSLKQGIDTLDSGVDELNEKVQALPDGVEQLKDGTMQLSEGIQKIYDEGISKILDLVDTDLEGLIDRFKAVKDLSEEYNNFSGISDDMDGSVKFIFKTGK